MRRACRRSRPVRSSSRRCTRRPQRCQAGSHSGLGGSGLGGSGLGARGGYRHDAVTMTSRGFTQTSDVAPHAAEERLPVADAAACGLCRRPCSRRHRFSAHRHWHRRGDPPVRGLQVPGALSVRRSNGRQRDADQRQLPGENGRREGSVGLRVDDAGKRLGVSGGVPGRWAGRHEGAGRRVEPDHRGLSREGASRRSVSRARNTVSARRRGAVERARTVGSDSEALHARRRQCVRRRDSRRLRQGVRRELLRDLRSVVHDPRPVARSRPRVQGGVSRSVRPGHASCEHAGVPFRRRQRSA